MDELLVGTSCMTFSRDILCSALFGNLPAEHMLISCQCHKYDLEGKLVGAVFVTLTTHACMKYLC